MSTKPVGDSLLLTGDRVIYQGVEYEIKNAAEPFRPSAGTVVIGMPGIEHGDDWQTVPRSELTRPA